MTYELHCGDCLDVLATMPCDSIDAIVTDPPYGLRFMSKKWDYDVPTVEQWSECLRVLKPGGHLLSFGGSRTYHRMAVNVEDAGFEIRDQIMWLYGCLSEDTEILTDQGWETYDTVLSGSMVMCYNIGDKSFDFMPTSEVVTYDYEDTAYRIQSDCTDQIVSRNHRCIVERGGEQVFRYAETLERQEVVPVLEAVPEMRETVSMLDKRASDQEQVLQHGMSERQIGQGQDGSPVGKTSKLCHCQMCCLREKDRTPRKSDQAHGHPSLQLSMQRETEGRGVEETRSQGARWLDTGIPQVLRQEDDRGKQPCVEGWSHLRQAQGAIPELQNQICKMPAGILENGAQGWLCDGTSAQGCYCNQSTFETVGSCSSHRSQSRKQQLEQFDAVSDQSRPQDVRGGQYRYKTTLATVTPIHYRGIVWCVRVPTGAFVARRNGHVFVTGNSGFPKSMDIGKQLDKMAGAEREVIGTKLGRPGMAKDGSNQRNGFDNAFGGLPSAKPMPTDITAPATEAAKQWDGWGTALKPAHEPIVLARKPIPGTIAANVLEWGTGAINIEDCRVPISDGATMARNNKPGDNGWKNSSGGKNSAALNGEPSGRWPANVIHDGSDEVVAGFPVTDPSKSNPRNNRNTIGGNGKYNGGVAMQTRGHDDTGTAARFFYCAKASRSERTCGGKVDNNHPTVKPLELMRYLCRLITPPDGVILDPFAGSGSTGIAALAEGFGFVGIERDPHNADIARQRIEAVHAQPTLFEVEYSQ